MQFSFLADQPKWGQIFYKFALELCELLFPNSESWIPNPRFCSNFCGLIRKAELLWKFKKNLVKLDMVENSIENSFWEFYPHCAGLPRHLLTRKYPTLIGGSATTFRGGHEHSSNGKRQGHGHDWCKIRAPLFCYFFFFSSNQQV